MSYGVTIEVGGERALFSRPELSVERLSYDCITPSAAVGILESIYWHPPMKYSIDRIHVLNPINFCSIRRNEVGSKASARTIQTDITNDEGELPYINTNDDRQQRTSTMLTNVRYVIEAHFDIDEHKLGEGDSAAKFASILKRRLSKGQCFQQPYLGVRECAAWFRAYEGPVPPRGYYTGSGNRDLGLMLYGMDYTDPKDITPMFYRVVMCDGLIDVAGSEVYR